MSWLSRLTPRAGDGALVFAFPPAGAGSAIFRRWLPVLPPGIELVAFKAPGREDRLAEPPVRSIGPLADAAAEAVLAYAGRPFTIFGHSMGALLGREVARRVPADLLRLLVVAGAAPPHRPVPSLARASEAELVQTLAAWGGTPPAVLAEPAVFRIFLPSLRADFAVADSGRRPAAPDELIDAPILALAGTRDETALPHTCAEWNAWTRAGCTVHVVDGGHFFPFTHADQVLTLVGAQCR